MLLDGDHLGDGGLQDADIPTFAIPSATRSGASTSTALLRSSSGGSARDGLGSPVEETAQPARDDGHGKTRGEAEGQHAQGGAGEAKDENGLAADPVAEPAPQDAGRELGEGEGRGDHAGVDGYPTLVVRDVERLDHVIDIGKDGHEGNRLADPTYGYARRA